jgi:hypothetical protein
MAWNELHCSLSVVTCCCCTLWPACKSISSVHNRWRKWLLMRAFSFFHVTPSSFSLPSRHIFSYFWLSLSQNMYVDDWSVLRSDRYWIPATNKLCQWYIINITIIFRKTLHLRLQRSSGRTYSVAPKRYSWSLLPGNRSSQLILLPTVSQFFLVSGPPSGPLTKF